MKLQKDIRILIVDDYELARHILRCTLNQLRLNNLVEAKNAADAWEALKLAHQAGTPIDLVMCDVNMPTLTGLEFLRSVRSSPIFKNLPFVLLSVNLDFALKKSASEAGVTGFIDKPPLANSIEKILLKIFDQSAA